MSPSETRVQFCVHKNILLYDVIRHRKGVKIMLRLRGVEDRAKASPNVDILALGSDSSPMLWWLFGCPKYLHLGFLLPDLLPPAAAARF